MTTERARIDALKFLVEGGLISRYGQLFDHIPKSVLAKELGLNYQSLCSYINNPSKICFSHLIALSDKTGITLSAVANLVVKDLLYKPKKCRHGTGNKQDKSG
jgi:hypothetical protein